LFKLNIPILFKGLFIKGLAADKPNHKLINFPNPLISLYRSLIAPFSLSHFGYQKFFFVIAC